MTSSNSREIFPVEVVSQTPQAVCAALLSLGEQWSEAEISILPDGSIIHNQEDTPYQIQTWDNDPAAAQDSFGREGRLMLVRRRL